MSESFPETIGSFRILSKLGQGGMGSVYRAVQGTLDRPVALKVLPPEFCSHTEYVARFLREARTIAAIRHENIIQVYESGEFKKQYYIAMELVDGGNLLNIADARQRINEIDGLKLMLQAAKGLNAAHAKGLIHRDIKPENLLIGTDHILRIVDFGLVMDSGSATQLTLAGTCLGTPMYMSPEQADGEIADPRSDLYSLGATFFRVFTGSPPFGASTVMNILYKQKFEKPPDPQDLRPDLSRGTSDLLLHLLAKRRDDRPEGATALISMIEDAIAGRPIPAPPPFLPLIPKPRTDGTESTLVASGDTAGALNRESRRATQQTESKSGLLALAILVIVCAAAIFAIASGSKPQTTQLQQQPTLKAPPQISDAELKERMAMGDAAFKSGRIKDARAIYLEALKLVPGHIDLISRRDRADRRINFDNEMRSASELEKQGKLADALSRFRNAQALDEENAAEVAAQRVEKAIDAAKVPVVDFTPAPPRDPKLIQLDRVEKEADAARAKEDFVNAEAAYALASELAAPARKGGFLEKARQCKRSNFLKEAKSAEAARDFPRAEAAYSKALEIVSDTLISEKLETIRQKIRDDEKIEANYLSAMREGQEALDKNDFADARVKFGSASGIKPDFSPPKSKLNEVDAREMFVKGDAARDAGDLAQARLIYENALKKCALLESETKLRIDALTKSLPRSARAIAKACALASDRMDDEAVAVLDEALKKEPGLEALKTARTALDAARSAEDLIAQEQKISSDAMERLRLGAELDEDDDATKNFIAAVGKTQLKLLEKSKKPLADFAAGDFESASASLAGARAFAAELQVELKKAVAHFAKQEEKFSGTKLPIFKKPVGGDRKKEEKYHSLAESLTQLLGQINALQKP